MYKSHNPPKKLTLLGVYNGIVHYKIGDFMRRIRRKKKENNNYKYLPIFNNNDKWVCGIFN